MDYINIIGTIFDNSTEHTAALASQVKDLRLNKKQQDINQEVKRDIQLLGEVCSRVPGMEADLHHAVSTRVQQSFTEQEKALGRENIGAIGFIPVATLQTLGIVKLYERLNSGVMTNKSGLQVIDSGQLRINCPDTLEDASTYGVFRDGVGQLKTVILHNATSEELNAIDTENASSRAAITPANIGIAVEKASTSNIASGESRPVTGGTVYTKLLDYYTKTEADAITNLCVTRADYNSSTKRLRFYNGDTWLFSIDATPFIKDGMVNNVEISNGNLVVTFNTDSGLEPISIPLTDIFNPSNYYTKTEINNSNFLSYSSLTLTSELLAQARSNIGASGIIPYGTQDVAGIVKLHGRSVSGVRTNKSGLTFADLEGSLSVNCPDSLAGALNDGIYRNGTGQLKTVITHSATATELASIGLSGASEAAAITPANFKDAFDIPATNYYTKTEVNGIRDNLKTFYAVKGTTSYADILAAYNAGATVYCIINTVIWSLMNVKTDGIYFVSPEGTSFVYISSDNTWSTASYFNIDFSPTPNSFKVVTSGGIYNAIANVYSAIAALHLFEPIFVDTLPTASENTLNKIYVTAANNDKANNKRTEWYSYSLPYIEYNNVRYYLSKKGHASGWTPDEPTADASHLGNVYLDPGMHGSIDSTGWSTDDMLDICELWQPGDFYEWSSYPAHLGDVYTFIENDVEIEKVFTPSGWISKNDLDLYVVNGIEYFWEKIGDDVSSVVDGILSLIPSLASSNNKLTDKNYVDTQIDAFSPTFRGIRNLVSDLSLTTSATRSLIIAAITTLVPEADKNDYMYVLIPTADATPTEIESVDKYTYSGIGWGYEYTLSSSGFTSAQWAAINSGITANERTIAVPFIATYGTTTKAELDAAIAANKSIIIFYSNRVYRFSGTVALSYYFTAVTSSTIYNISFAGGSGVWLNNSQEFQAKLTSGTTIKTINGNSILGYGNISIPQQVYWAEFDTTTYNDVITAVNANKLVYAKDGDILLPLTKVDSNNNMITFSGMVGTDNYVWYLDYADGWLEFVY